MIRIVARAAGALTIALLTSSCSFLKRQAFAEPVVDVSDVRLAGVGMEGGKINVMLTVYNPNKFRLDAKEVNYAVDVDTTRLTSGTLETPVMLPPRDSTRFSIPVSFTFRDVMQLAQRLSERGSLPFRLSGDLKILTSVGSVTRSFSQSGTYDGVNISMLPRK